MTKWDRRFLQLAREVAGWSKDPSTKVGAVLVDDNRTVIGLGYNGFPRRVEDSAERYENREIKYAMVVHAEVNAILNATKTPSGATLYLWPFMPCSTCAGAVIQAGVARVVTIENDNPRWAVSFELTRTMFREARVTIETYHVDELELLVA